MSSWQATDAPGRAVDMVLAGGPLVDGAAGAEVGQVGTGVLVDGGAAGEGVPVVVVEAAALVDQGAFLELAHGDGLEVGRVVVETATVDVLAAVEVDHVEAAGVEDVGEPVGNFVEEVRFLVDDVAVDAAVDGVVPALRFRLVR